MPGLQSGFMPDEPDPVTARLSGNTDARAWAQEWYRIAGDSASIMEEGSMITWFANAIETGRAAGFAAGRAAILAVTEPLVESTEATVEALSEITGEGWAGPALTVHVDFARLAVASSVAVALGAVASLDRIINGDGEPDASA
jgi:hypothetical protein